MISTKLPYNPIAHSMIYNNKVLTISIKKGANTQYRSYKCEDKLIAYGLFYCKTAEQVLKVFNEEIKGKLTVLTVK